jgi:23S rRNA (uracil1939-C5)-methyltransferase
MAQRRRRRLHPIPAEQPNLTLRIESLVFGGRGLARTEDGRVVLVAFAAPGEVVEAAIEWVHPDYSEAAAVRVIEPSPGRVEPQCPLFGECGGCQLQHMAYGAQIAAKEEIVREQMRRIGRLDDAVVRPCVGAANPWEYRNHIRFSTGRRYGDLGFIRRSGRGLLKVEHCPIADPWVNEVLPLLQGKGSGLHQVQLRHNAVTGSFLVAPEIPSADIETGQAAYVERLAGRDFQVSASSFFQVNNAQAEEMVRLVGEVLPAQGKLLIDAFAGVGTFAILFADRFERAIAIEESRTAMQDAGVNVAGVGNVELLPGKVEHVLPLLEAAPDAVILDPPRAGCQRVVLDAVRRFRPGVVVYVSCNPATLARDLRVLVDGGFRLDSVTPIDMFPQTGHIECVSRLSLVDASVPG